MVSCVRTNTRMNAIGRHLDLALFSGQSGRRMLLSAILLLSGAVSAQAEDVVKVVLKQSAKDQRVEYKTVLF